MVENVLTAWRDLREAVALRNRAACDDWNSYEQMMSLPKTKGKPRPAMPLIVRPLATQLFPEKDYEFLEVAVCESNLAVILHEFGDNRVDWANEASFLINRSVETLDNMISRYEKEARQVAAKMLGSGRAILPELTSSVENSTDETANVKSSLESGKGSEGDEGDNVEVSKHSEAAEEDEEEESPEAKKVHMCALVCAVALPCCI